MLDEILPRFSLQVVGLGANLFLLTPIFLNVPANAIESLRDDVKLGKNLEFRSLCCRLVSLGLILGPLIGCPRLLE